MAVNQTKFLMLIFNLIMNDSHLIYSFDSLNLTLRDNQASLYKHLARTVKGF